MEIIFGKRMKSHHDVGGILNKYLEKKIVTESDLMKFLNRSPKNISRAIYVHTPYCDKICSFCNLNRKQLQGSLDEYSNFIASEFKKYGKTKYFQERDFEVIFFGGGTPTVYKPNQLEIILKSIQENVSLAPKYEFTFETTLHNLSKEKLNIMMKYGVNRLSIGIQSFSEEGRKFYNRTFTKEETIDKLKKLKEYFKGDVCIDIIYNYPNQKEEDIKEDIKIIKELEISSVSFYSLMIHEGSNLSKDIKNEKVKIIENLEKEKKLHDIFIEELCKDEKYYILELTKIAKKNGDNYQYIKVRNNGGDTFPIGVGAGGNVGNISIFRMNKNLSFFSNISNLHKKFSLLSGLLQFPIIQKNEIKKILDKKEYNYFLDKINEFKEKKLFIENEKSFIFTKDGIFWGNNIGYEIVKYIVEKVFEK